MKAEFSARSNDRDKPTHQQVNISPRMSNDAVRLAQFNNLQRHLLTRTRCEPPNKPHYSVVTPKSKPTLRQTWPRLETSAARCVRDVDDQGVLQFTLLHAVCCALHRRTSRVIHRLELYFLSRIQYSFNITSNSIKRKCEAAGLMMGTLAHRSARVPAS